MTLFTGAPASPTEFSKKLPSAEAINRYYQATLGRRIDEDLAVSQFTRILLADLFRRFPASFEKHRPKVFVQGIPENVAIVSLVLLMKCDQAVMIDPMTIFKGRTELVATNRVVSMALEKGLYVATDSNLSSAFPAETVGLMDTVHRTMNQIKVAQSLISPPDTVDKALSNRIHDYITNVLPLMR